jgi:hypothetical protein
MSLRTFTTPPLPPGTPPLPPLNINTHAGILPASASSNLASSENANIGNLVNKCLGLIHDFEVYEQNSGRTMGKKKYDSTNATADADKGDELRQYIATISAAAVAKEDKQDELVANICDSAQKKNNEMVA